MTNVVKCSKCNIVIDEMLSYIQNKVSVIDEVTLVRICTSSFTSEEIKTSKSLLFDSIPTELRKVVRKNKGKEERDMADIIKLFKSAEPTEIPVFVARQLEKLPPITFDHLDCTKLLKDIVRMQATINEMKTTYATLDDLNELKDEFVKIKCDSLPPTSAFKVNTKRGAWLLDSGPMGLSNVHNSSMNEECIINNSGLGSDSSKKTSPRYRNIMRVDEKQRQKSENSKLKGTRLQRSEPAGSVNITMTHECDEAPSAAATSEPSNYHLCVQSRRPAAASPPQVAIASQLTDTEYTTASVANLQREGANEITSKLCNKDEEWQQVSYKKRTQYRFAGKSGIAKDLDCNFKAAERKIPILITNIHGETTEDDIITYIYRKTQETVCLEKIQMRKDKGHNAYKFFVSESKVSLYLDENIWPAGIIFRRFMNFNYRNTNRFSSVDGAKQQNNG